MYIYGGYDHHGFICSDIYTFNYKTLSWNAVSYSVANSSDPSSGSAPHDSSTTTTSPLTSPSNTNIVDESFTERYHHSCILWNNKLIIFGGKTSKNKPLNSIMLYDIESNTISNAPTTGKVPSPRWGQIAVLAGKENDSMFIYGGWGGEALNAAGNNSTNNNSSNNENNTSLGREELLNMDLIFECNLKTMVWRCISIDMNGGSNMVGERYFHAAVYAKNERELVIIGGKSVSNDYCFNDLNRITLYENDKTNQGAANSNNYNTSNTSNNNNGSHSPSTAQVFGVETAAGEEGQNNNVNDVNSREIILKVQYGDEIRKFQVHENIKFINLLSLLLHAYSEELNYTQPNNNVIVNPALVPFRLVYKDEEGDMITIRSQSELSEAIKYYWKVSGAGGTPNSFRIYMQNKPLSGMNGNNVIVPINVNNTSPHNSMGSSMTPPLLDNAQVDTGKKSIEKNKNKKKKQKGDKVKKKKQTSSSNNNIVVLNNQPANPNNNNNNNNNNLYNNQNNTAIVNHPASPPPQGMTRKWTRYGNILGIGGFGTVYEALLDTGEFVAIKQLTLPGYQNNPDTLAKILQFQREIQIMQNLHHPHIVRYKGSERTDDTLYIFMELVSGGSISALLKKYKTFALLTTKNYTRQILLGVEYLHRENFVHRDIKGPNILVDSQGNVKLADFGASKQLKELTSYCEGCETRTGTPFWMAPEVVRGSKYGRKADIYSVGCVVYEMVSGSGPPFSDLNPVTALFKIGSLKEEEFEAEVLSGLRSLGKDWEGWEEWIAVDGEGGKFLRKCMERDPKIRATALELLSHEFLKENPSSGTSQNDEKSTK